MLVAVYIRFGCRWEFNRIVSKKGVLRSCTQAAAYR